MADITVTAANVRPGENATIADFEAGEALTAGQAVYQASDTKLYKCTTANATNANAKGVALTNAGAGERVVVATKGPVNMGTSGGLTKGEAYAVSDTGGGVRPIADNGAGDFATLLGFATTTDLLQLNILASGVAK